MLRMVPLPMSYAHREERGETLSARKSPYDLLLPREQSPRRRHQPVAVAGHVQLGGELAEARLVGLAELVEILVELAFLQPRRRPGRPRDLLADDVGIGAAQRRLALGLADQAGAVLDQGGLAEGDRPLLAAHRAEAE